MRAVVVVDVARPAGRVRTRKTIKVCMYWRAHFFLSFFFLPSLSTSCLLKKTHVYVCFLLAS